MKQFNCGQKMNLMYKVNLALDNWHMLIYHKNQSNQTKTSFLEILLVAK